MTQFLVYCLFLQQFAGLLYIMVAYPGLDQPAARIFG